MPCYILPSFMYVRTCGVHVHVCVCVGSLQILSYRSCIKEHLELKVILRVTLVDIN